MKRNPNVTGRALVSNIRANVVAFGQEVGVAEDARFYTAGDRNEMTLVLRLAASVVRGLESKRDGGPLTLALDVDGRVSVSRNVPLFSSSVKDHRDVVLPVTEHGQQVVRPVQGEPARLCGQVTITVDAIVWSNMLTATGYGDNVFVEIPLPPSPGPPWDEVWKALRTARDALNRGGATAWKMVVAECRVALEHWDSIEPIDHGDGGLTANRDQREARTLKQRQDALRWHAHQLAHYFQHNHASECTRDDAVLVLSTLAGLLAIRKP